MERSPTVLVPTLLAVAGFGLGVFLTVNGYGHATVFAATFTLGLVQLTEVQRQQAADRIREALRRADIGIRKAALHMQVDPSDLERALSGERKLDLWRLEMLPEVFWQEYWPLLARDKGLPDTFRAWVKALPVLLDAQKVTA